MIHLGIAYNDISNIDALGETETQLVSLDLGNNLISKLDDLEPLVRMRSLTKLVLCGNPISLLPGYRKDVIQKLITLTSLDDIIITSEERLPIPVEEDNNEEVKPPEESKTGVFTLTFVIEEVKGLPLPDDFEKSDDVTDVKSKGKPQPPKQKSGKGKQEEEESTPSRVLYLRGCAYFPQQDEMFSTKEIDRSTQSVDDVTKTAQLSIQSSSTFTFHPTLEVGLWLRSVMPLELREIELKSSDKNIDSEPEQSPIDNLLGVTYLDLTQLTRCGDDGVLPSSFSVTLPVATNENISYKKKRVLVSGMAFDAAVTAACCVLPVTAIVIAATSLGTTPVSRKHSTKSAERITRTSVQQERIPLVSKMFVSLRVSVNLES